MKKQFTISFFNKLLFISCIIGIFPILLLGYLSYHKSSSALMEELTASNKLILQQNKARVESMLKTIDTLTTQTINTPVTTNAMSMHSVLDLPFEHRHRDVFDKLINSLVQIQVYELGISDVKLVSYQEDWLVDSGAVYPMKNRIRVDRHDDLLIQTYQQLLTAGATGNPSYWELQQEDSGKFMLKLNKHVPLNSLRPYGLLSVYIPLAEINKQLSGDSTSGNTFVVTAEGRIVSSLVSDEVGTLITEQTYYKEMMRSQNSEGYFVHSLNHEKLLIQFNKALYNDWIYISVTPYKELVGKTNHIKLYTTICAAILILIVITISYFFSDKMSSPIVRLYRSISQSGKSSSRNELGYISDHLKELTLSKHQLNVKVKQLHKQAQEFFVIKLISGHLNLSVIEEQLEKLSLPDNWEAWNVVSLQIERTEQKYSNDDMDLLLFAITNIIDETIEHKHIFPPVTNNQMLHIFIGQSMESTIPLKIYVYNTVLKLQEHIKKFLKLSVNVGISREHHDWRYASLATDESIQALYYRRRLEEATILSIEDAELIHSDVFRYPKEIENQLIESIKFADGAQAEAQLHDLLTHIYSYANHHSDYQHALNRLFNNVTGMLHDAGESINKVLDLHRLPGFIYENTQSVEDKKVWLLDHIIIPLIHWNQQRIQKTEMNISQFMIQQIVDHYDQDLSIDYFASQLNYHPSYISRVFKKDTGMTFSDYLSNYRIDKAKHMLKHSDMRIADIAEKLRYSTASNFNRHFKKVVQLTPSQYREQQD